jgi:hypothetical protein
MSRKSFFKAGFWGSFGFVCGIGSIVGIGMVIAISSQYFREWKDRAGFEWEKLWYSKEQREFYNCFKEEYKILNNLPTNTTTSITGLSEFQKHFQKGTPTERCSKKGFKPFGTYLN